jgi:hypothetical protein
MARKWRRERAGDSPENPGDLPVTPPVKGPVISA